MKISAAIFACILLFLTVQPSYNAVLSLRQDQPPMSCCNKKKCNKDRGNKEKQDCNNHGCNPFIGCPYGNFYIPAAAYEAQPITVTQQEKRAYLTDSYIFKYISDNWHPPELASVYS